MKKLLFTTFIIVAVTGSVAAQTSDAAPPASAPALTKEQKAAQKFTQDSLYMVAFKGANLSDDEITQAKAIMAEASKQSNEIKKNEKLSDTEKEDAKKLISNDKNNKLKALMGKDRYKVYSDIRKQQKEAAGTKPE